MSNWNRQSTRFYSKAQENTVANSLGGKTTPNSGATLYKKGDITIGQHNDTSSWLLECKTCTSNKQSFSIKKKWLLDLREEAIGQGKLGYAVVFNFGPNQENYYIINETKFKEFLEVESNNE